MPDGHLHYISPACERVTGYSPAEFAFHPEPIHEIVIDADQEKSGSTPKYQIWMIHLTT
jgi:hypothetical protein